MEDIKEFIYNNYKIEEDDENIYFEYEFIFPGLTTFNPKIIIKKKNFNWKRIDSNILKNMVFNLGMVEAISYFKAICPRKMLIKCGYLDDYQKNWFKKLYYLGLGEFRYRNDIETNYQDFVEFICEGNKLDFNEEEDKNSGIMIPIGGGKDSNVTLELLKDKYQNLNPFMIGGKEVSFKCVEAAGFSRDSVIEVTRIIDKNLIELNGKGYLNGHTPFSAMVAFLTYIIGYLLGKKYIALSNENSANESNVKDEKINHQYSKTFEFENDFREYSQKYLKGNVEYFSFLRPISELQIAMIFSRFKKYHEIFKSCNVGSKVEPWVWCGNCPKCLFVYIILSPFIEKDELVKIFKEDLYNKESLLETFIELCGFGKIKPFECVGTYSEVRYCVSKMIEKYKKKNIKMPFLLNYYYENFELENTTNERLLEFSDNNNLPEEFINILKENIYYGNN